MKFCKPTSFLLYGDFVALSVGGAGKEQIASPVELQPMRITEYPEFKESQYR